MKNIELKVLNLHLKTLNGIPKHATPGSAGFDLIAPLEENLVLKPGETTSLGLGFAIHIKDPTIAAVILPRSGLGSRGLSLLNTIGLIDSDYQGEIIAKIQWAPTNGTDNLVIQPGDRLLQLMLLPVIKANFNEVDNFEEGTERGAGGYGSTGVK